MKTFVTLGQAKWSSSHPDRLPHIDKLGEKLVETLAAYAPKPIKDMPGAYGYPTFELQAEADDATLRNKLKEFEGIVKKLKPASAAVIHRQPTSEEVERVRFLEPYYFVDYVDERGFKALLNPEMEACSACHYPNYDFMPDPFLVNSSVLKNSDVFSTCVGLIVVRERVLELLKRAVPDAITFGKAAIAKSKACGKPGEQFYWIKPKEMLRKRVRVIDGKKTCPTCKRTVQSWLGMLDAQVMKVGPGIFDASIRVEDFGGAEAGIASIDNSATGDWPTLVMSGRLLGLLKSNGVKGIADSTNRLPPRCVFSDKGESTLHSKRQATARDAEKPEAVKAKTAQEFKDAPWDCAKDGHVYFELSGPEFVVFDPMTGEQNEGGPFKVKGFKGAGLYRMPVSAIKAARKGKRAVAVDSAMLVFVDSKFSTELLNAYDWDDATNGSGAVDRKYHDKIATQLGTHFGICTPPPKKFKSDFKGDGFYTIDVAQIAAG